MPLSSLRALALPVAAFASLAGSAAAQSPAQNDSAAKAATAAKGLPLIPTRTLSFTTTEGSWLSIDIDPTGRTLIFDLLGDLYTMPITGGTAARITSGLPYDMQARYSPDGKSIVFVSDRDGAENIWIADADGANPRALTTTERENYVSPAWTPDGQYIVATKGSQLWIWHKDGGSGVQMTGQARPGGPAPSPQNFYLGAAFGADSTSLWVNVRGVPTPSLAAGTRHAHGEHDGRSTAREIGPIQIAELERGTGQLRIRTHEHEGAFRPVPSPDGKWLVYATRFDSRAALKLLDLTTGEDRWLVMDVQRDDHQGGGSRDRDLYPGSAFTPDSRALITSYGGAIRRVEIPSGRVSTIPFSAAVDQPLGPLVKFDYPINDSVLTVTQIRGARPSPDGKRLAFTALGRLWIADLPASAGGPGNQNRTPAVIRNARRLTDADVVEHGPVWSPDGRYLAYVTWDDSLGGQIQRVRTDIRAAPEALTRVPAFYDKLAYTRDGTRLLAIRGSKQHRMRTLEDFGNQPGGRDRVRLAARHWGHPDPDPLGRRRGYSDPRSAAHRARHLASLPLDRQRRAGLDAARWQRPAHPAQGDRALESDLPGHHDAGGPRGGGALARRPPGARHGAHQRLHDHGAAGRRRGAANGVGGAALDGAALAADPGRRRLCRLEQRRQPGTLLDRSELLPV